MSNNLHERLVREFKEELKIDIDNMSNNSNSNIDINKVIIAIAI